MDALTLSKATGIPMQRALRWHEPLTKAMEYAEIIGPGSNRLRQANFLAQLGHESGGFVYAKELGGESYFLKYDGRADLGNTEPGDGPRFRGRGLIQVTGRNNYRQCSIALFGDERLLTRPELLEQPEYAALSAAWFWKREKLNLLADVDRFTDTSRRINGGSNGLEDRRARYKLALTVL